MAWGRNRRKAKRLARAKAMRDTRAKAIAMGLSSEEIRDAVNDAYHSFNTKPTWRIKLRDNSAKFGGAWGKLGVSLGTLALNVPVIGTVMGGIMIGAGTAHNIAAEQHGDKLAREEQAKANTRLLLSVITDEVVPSDEEGPLPSADDYEDEEFVQPEDEGGIIQDFLGGLYLTFFAKQAEQDLYYYQTKEYKDSMEDIRKIAMERGVSVAFIREEYRREFGTLTGTIFDYTIKVER